MSDQTQTTTAVTARPSSSLPFAGMGDIASAGDLLAQAGFLGCRNAGEGFVLMATCQQTGMSLIEFQQKYHFRQGRFSIQAHALLAEFVLRGGSYEVIERSPTRAALKLTKGGNTYTSEVTWDQALAEPFVYAGREDEALAELAKPAEKRKLKAKYSTPRSRMQMLWARAVSDGVVVVDPGARGGMYTPEESEDFMALPAASEPRQLPEAAARDAVASAAVEVVQPVALETAAAATAGHPVAEEPAAAQPEATATAEPATAAAADPFAKRKGYAARETTVPGATVCPIAGPMLGKPWDSMDDETLGFAIEYADQSPHMTSAHVAAIQAILAERKLMTDAGGK